MKRVRRGPLIAIAAIALVALLVPLLPLADPLHMDVVHHLSPPSLQYPLGQDEYGRDVLSRLLWGARTSLAVAAASASLACLFGTALGLAGGFMRGVAELVAVRSMDIVLCFPPLLLALLIVMLLGPGAATLIPVLAVLYTPGFVRVVYAGVLSVRSQDYVEAMRALGAGPSRIMLRTILPNVAGPLLVQFSLAAAAAVVLESGLSFLGLGVVPPAPSWGLMIGAARATMNQAPLLLVWPCAALSLTILAMNALCDALRDAVDPHTQPARLRRHAQPPPPPSRPATGTAVLDVRNLMVEIDTPHGTIQPVRDVSFTVRAGETLAIVGESGSGKTLTGLAIMGLLPPAAFVGQGSAWLQGHNLLRLDDAGFRRVRGGVLSMIFQDPLSSLNPVHRIGTQIAEAMHAHFEVAHFEAKEEVAALLDRVGMPDPERRARAYPHELSGGMRQRAMIAMAIANDPRLLIADEPTTALDVTIQAQVLDLLGDLQREFRMGLVFISHSLPLVAEIADRVLVMYAGEIVEQGDVREVFAAPMHPYTVALLQSAPRDDGTLPVSIPGAVPLPHAMPPGCGFAPRCGLREAACEAQHPPLVELASGRATRCLRWRELA
ncbi:MAG TPA: dipeptide/oligopeptide/nickel ABC transporter permease/ATP-binding protein [Acetobacteraceae bacterium]|nr:dipeptide/oligopeptide/nickel ABC transporter permease/ATP-binding protein [Acetobacteraceae bacterium]